jgi:hypothetical protein
MTRVDMKCHNIDDRYDIEKVTSCETRFEGVCCLSFYQIYKMEIALNMLLKFDRNVLVTEHIENISTSQTSSI